MNINWVLTANGPGELTSQAKPLAETIRKNDPSAHIVLILLPCQFASGHELEIAQGIAAINFIVTPKKYRSLVFNSKDIDKIKKYDTGVIMFLGGDPFHALLLKNKLKYSLFAYTEKKSIAWASKFKEVFFAHDVGNLMVDAAGDIPAYSGRHFHDSDLSVGLYPGSRPGYIKYMIPLLYDISKKIKSKISTVNFYWGIPKHLQNSAYAELSELINKYPSVKKSNGLDLIITLLGTNTAIQAVKGIPMVVLFPFHRPDLVPLIGLLGHFTKIPIIGYLIKWLLLQIAVHRLGNVAIPNIVSKQEITPEIKGYFKNEDVVHKAYELLKDIGWRNRISSQLRFSLGKKGAAQKIYNKILEHMQ